MEFLKVFWKNKRLVWQLGKNDFKNRFANTSLGSIWGFLQPFVFMMMYVIVFQYIFKQTLTWRSTICSMVYAWNGNVDDNK